MKEIDTIFSKEDCNEILKKCFKDNFDKIKYLSYKFYSLSGDVEGYLSEHYSLTITYQDIDETKEKKFFVKAVIDEESFLSMFAKSLDVFRKEAFIYTEFIPLLEKLKNYKQFLPKCYFTKKNILVLEDLSECGFKIGERLKFYNIEQCKVALKTLAHYHAYSIIFEEIKSKETNTEYRLNKQYPDELADRLFGEYKSSPTRKFMESSITSIIDLIAELPDDKCQNKKQFTNLLISTLQGNDKEEKISHNYRLTCTHGDLWANNIMFKYDNGQIIDCRIIDFQILNYSMLGFDVELFFYGNTDAEFRTEHKEQLLHYYYDCFEGILNENNIDARKILTYQHLKEMCILRGPEAKVQAISDMSLLSLLPQEIQIHTKNNTDYMKTVLIDDRSKYILDCYKNNAKYRNVITAELIDLYSILRGKELFLNSL